MNKHSIVVAESHPPLFIMRPPNSMPRGASSPPALFAVDAWSVALELGQWEIYPLYFKWEIPSQKAIPHTERLQKFEFSIELFQLILESPNTSIAQKALLMVLSSDYFCPHLATD